jgi:hypothetical protein
MDSPTLLRAQGLFYLVTGLWPWLHRRSFTRVTGEKVDFWLVKTVGALLAASGLVFLRHGRRRRASADIRLLAALEAAVLAAIDVRYAATGRISPVYGLDALAESAIVAAWLRARPRSAPALPLHSRRSKKALPHRAHR